MRLSRDTTRTVTNKDISRIVDSLTRAAVQVETARLFSTVDRLETTLIVFDTVTPSAGASLPPVRAVIRQTARHEEVARDTTAATVTVDTQVTSELTDRSVEQTEQTPLAKSGGSWRKTTKKVLIALVIASALVLALYGIYKLIKFFKK